MSTLGSEPNFPSQSPSGPGACLQDGHDFVSTPDLVTRNGVVCRRCGDIGWLREAKQEQDNFGAIAAAVDYAVNEVGDDIWGARAALGRERARVEELESGKGHV